MRDSVEGLSSHQAPEKSGARRKSAPASLVVCGLKIRVFTVKIRETLIVRYSL
jgi:hypothetical protein